MFMQVPVNSTDCINSDIYLIIRYKNVYVLFTCACKYLIVERYTLNYIEYIISVTRNAANHQLSANPKVLFRWYVKQLQYWTK